MEVKVHKETMRLIGEGKITSDLGTSLIVVLDENDRVVYANEPLLSKINSSKDFIGKDFKKLSTLTTDDLKKNDQVIVNNLFGKTKVKWFITVVDRLKILIEN